MLHSEPFLPLHSVICREGVAGRGACFVPPRGCHKWKSTNQLPRHSLYPFQRAGPIDAHNPFPKAATYLAPKLKCQTLLDAAHSDQATPAVLFYLTGSAPRLQPNTALPLILIAKCPSHCFRHIISVALLFVAFFSFVL